MRRARRQEKAAAKVKRQLVSRSCVCPPPFPTLISETDLLIPRNATAPRVSVPQKATAPQTSLGQNGNTSPGSAAGAAALSGQGPPGRGIAVRQFSPLRRRGAAAPAADMWGPPKTPAFCSVLCSSPFFPFFGACGSRWVNVGQHRPQDGPT